MSIPEALPHLGSQPHTEFTASYPDQDQVTGLMSARTRGRRIKQVGLPVEEQRGNTDPRHVVLHAGGAGLPAGDFLVDNALMQDIRKTLDTRPSWYRLSHNEMGRLAAGNSVSAVRPAFTHDAINMVNKVYYSSPGAYSAEAGLASLFVKSDVVNLVNGAFLAAEAGTPGKWMRIKELSSGARTSHWHTMARAAQVAGVPGLDVTLTDFFRPPIGPSLPANLRLASEAYSLFDDFPDLPPDKRFDAIFATYGFDSVWQPEDMRLTRIGGKWYRSAYRVKVDDWSPRKPALLRALRAGKPLRRAHPSDYEGIFVEEVMQRIAAQDVPYAEILEQWPENLGLNVPGGLIKRALQAFERQLHTDGVFVSIDIAITEVGDATQVASLVSGTAARFKVEDYAIAAQVLRKLHNLHVELISLPGLVDHFLPSDWQEDVGDKEREAILDESTVAMVVRRKPRYT